MQTDIALAEAPHPLADLRWLIDLDAATGYLDTAVVLAELITDVVCQRLTVAGLRAKYIDGEPRKQEDLPMISRF